jgi:DNA-binding transcriptional LysR family regulator
MDNNKYLFDGMAIFCEVVEANGFAVAAARMGHSASHVSKAVTRLESRLGARLLNRTTRTLSLTEIGRNYYEQSRQIIDDARAVQSRILNIGENPIGLLRVSVPVSFSQTHTNKWLPEFLQLYPDVRLEVEVSDRLVDIVAEGFDVVIRAARLDDTGLIARKLTTSRLVTVASAEYLQRHGVPETPHDLSGHTLIDFSYRKMAGSWEYRTDNGRSISVAIAPRLVCNSAETELAAALAGAGITRLPSMACEKELASGQLVPILESFAEEPIGVYALYPSRAHLAAKVRAFVDFLVSKCVG